MAVSSLGSDLRSVLRCIAQSDSARDALYGICRIAAEQGRFTSVRIGRYDRSNGGITWIAAAFDESHGEQDEAACVAIVRNGSPWGVLSACRASDDKSSDEGLTFLEDTCLVIGLALESQRIAGEAHPTPPDGFVSQAATALAQQHSLHGRGGSAQSTSELLATMAHEFRSPLTAVIGFTGMLLQQIPGPLNPEQQRQMEMIRSSGWRLLDLIKDLLDLAKLALDKTGVQTAPFDLSDPLRLVATREERVAAAKGIVLLCELPESPIPIVSDRRMVEQVISELVDNAVKFTECGQVKLTACALRGTRPGETADDVPADYACIRIMDTGIGIASDAMPRLFTAFGHAGHGKTHQNEGSHLGLALCKGLIDLLRGSIHVDSHPARGSIFTIHLPLQWQIRGT